MRCAATTRCSPPPKASSACGKCRCRCSNRRRPSGSTSRVHGDRNRSTSSSRPMPGACPSRGAGGIPTARAPDQAGLPWRNAFSGLRGRNPGVKAAMPRRQADGNGPFKPMLSGSGLFAERTAPARAEDAQRAPLDHSPSAGRRRIPTCRQSTAGTGDIRAIRISKLRNRLAHPATAKALTGFGRRRPSNTAADGGPGARQESIDDDLLPLMLPAKRACRTGADDALGFCGRRRGAVE